MYSGVVGLLLALCVTYCHGGCQDKKTDQEFAECILEEVMTPKAQGQTLFGEITDGASGFTNNVMGYQRGWGLNVTGKLDAATLAMMKLPKCGMRGFESQADDMKKRRKRFTVSSSKWDNSSPLSWYFERYSSQFSQTDQKRIIRDALDEWSKVANIDFVEGNPNNKDINIIFGARAHSRDEGTGGSFDGPGGTLAHAYFPGGGSISGDAHYDEDETFTEGTQRGVNLFQVAVHEFGHSLGIGHSNDRQAIMFPSYLGYNPNIRLGQDDINAIQSLYGARRTATTTTTTRRPTTTTTTTTTTRPQTGPPATTTTTRATTTTTRATTTTTPPFLPRDVKWVRNTPKRDVQ